MISPELCLSNPTSFRTLSSSSNQASSTFVALQPWWISNRHASDFVIERLDDTSLILVFRSFLMFDLVKVVKRLLFRDVVHSSRDSSSSSSSDSWSSSPSSDSSSSSSSRGSSSRDSSSSSSSDSSSSSSFRDSSSSSSNSSSSSSSDSSSSSSSSDSSSSSPSRGSSSRDSSSSSSSDSSSFSSSSDSSSSSSSSDSSSSSSSSSVSYVWLLFMADGTKGCKKLKKQKGSCLKIILLRLPVILGLRLLHLPFHMYSCCSWRMKPKDARN
nr:vitellogenin-1-like [Arachis hypogaea]